ncbi:MAG: ABC transporter ATP-binding protein [Alphaproteobacteria bacterium]|nr:ABC transporter ATP-binding protein [Alphaproteobacteria bacterium]
MKLLEIDALRVEAERQGGRSALVDHISLHLAPGEVLGLIGESGAGKSTIGLATLGFARPGTRITHGRILFRGVDLLRMPAAELRRLRGNRIAYMAQSAAAAFNPALRLGRQITHGPVRRGLMPLAEARAEMVSLFQRLRLPNPERFGQRYPHEASGGQLQRAMAAMALIARPELLVLDEPTTALDVTTQIDFLTIVSELIEERRLSALYITHDLALVAQLASRIIVLRAGKVEEEGATEGVLLRPKSPYARMLVAARQSALTSATAVPAQAPLLEARGISASYRQGVAVVDDVSLSLQQGEILAVIGESGSGKSSLARVILGLLPQRSGEIVYAGAPLPALHRRTRQVLRQIQFVHQQPDLALNPRQRVKDIIGRPLDVFFGNLGRQRAHRIDTLLETVGLPTSYSTRYPTKLSGGEKQRVCIARALAAEPALLICDEVTSSLDTLLAKDILSLLKRLRTERSLACIVITHDFGVVRALADTVAVMHRGKVVERGPAQAVLDSPQHAYTRQLLAAAPEMRLHWLRDRRLATAAASPAARSDSNPVAKGVSHAHLA